MIATLEASVAKNPEDEERIRQEIQTLKNKRIFLMKNPNVLGMLLHICANEQGNLCLVQLMPNSSLATKPPKKTTKSQSKRTNNDGGFSVHSFELNSSSTGGIPRGSELNPMASALYAQLSHPHLPQPSSTRANEVACILTSACACETAPLI